MGNIFLPKSSDFLCPACKDGSLSYRDHCKRIVRYEGGDKEWIYIPRYKCEKCARIHRMLIDSLVPFKHYSEEVICDSVNGNIKPDSSDYSPSEQTVLRWNHWIFGNEVNINGHLKSIGYRILGFTEELLKSGISLLEKLRSSNPTQWLKIIIRTIYNAGDYITPCYN